MNNIIAICGLVLMSTPATPNNLNNPQDHNFPAFDNGTSLVVNAYSENCVTCKDSEDLDLNTIVFIEAEEPLELGFNTEDYLPEGFDPYEVYVDLDAITFIEEDEEDVSFDTSEWLPNNFNPYAAPIDINSISYMEIEEDFFPAIDTKELLPYGFDPYMNTTDIHGSKVSLNSMNAR